MHELGEMGTKEGRTSIEILQVGIGEHSQGGEVGRWEGQVCSHRIHPSGSWLAKSEAEEKVEETNAQVFGWEVWNDGGHLTEEDTEELGDHGLSPEGLVESGCLLQGGEGHEPAMYPATGLRNLPLNWSVFLIFSSTFSKYKLKYDFENQTSSPKN